MLSSKREKPPPETQRGSNNFQWEDKPVIAPSWDRVKQQAIFSDKSEGFNLEWNHQPYYLAELFPHTGRKKEVVTHPAPITLVTVPGMDKVSVPR